MSGGQHGSSCRFAGLLAEFSKTRLLAVIIEMNDSSAEEYMKYSLEEIVPDKESLKPNKAVDVMWKWRKYRNVVFWKTVYRWGAAAVILTLVPYLLPDIIGKLGFAIFVFPAMAFLLSVFAAYLIAVEYKLYKQVDGIFRLLLGEYNPEEFPDNKPIDRVLRLSLGKVLVIAFLCFAVIIEFVNGLVLYHLVRRISV